MTVPLATAVSAGLSELAGAYPEHRMEHCPDGAGGAWVMLHDLCLGVAFKPSMSWVAFPLSAMYPRTHVYPHFVRPDLVRVDGTPLATPLHPAQQVPVFDMPAVMVSRSSPRWDPARDTAALKLQRVLLWFQSHASQAGAS